MPKIYILKYEEVLDNSNEQRLLYQKIFATRNGFLLFKIKNLGEVLMIVSIWCKLKF